MSYILYENDLPNDLDLGKEIAIDTETLGLNNFRDRLCMVQLSSGDGNAYKINGGMNLHDSHTVSTVNTVTNNINP